MKNCVWLMTLFVCCAFALMPSPSYAQMRVLSEQQLDAIVTTKLENCSTQGAKPNSGRIDAASIIPIINAREFPTDRVAKTLHGIWQGRVFGDDKDLSIDYFWMVDTKNNEGLIIALRNGKQTVAVPRDVAAAPKLTFLLCAREGYVPSTTPMIHEFVKVADSIDDAPRILEKATGVKFSKERPSLSDLWQGLLASRYFESMPAIAFAGALFKPIQIKRVANAAGPAGLSLQWDAEYRGGGSTTSIRYTIGKPMIGVEHGEFVGTTTKSGDYLVSSTGNGKIWKVEASVTTSDSTTSEKGSRSAFPVICYDLAFDKVVLGPLK